MNGRKMQNPPNRLIYKALSNFVSKAEKTEKNGAEPTENETAVLTYLESAAALTVINKN